MHICLNVNHQAVQYLHILSYTYVYMYMEYGYMQVNISWVTQQNKQFPVVLSIPFTPTSFGLSNFPTTVLTLGAPIPKLNTLGGTDSKTKFALDHLKSFGLNHFPNPNHVGVNYLPITLFLTK